MIKQTVKTLLRPAWSMLQSRIEGISEAKAREVLASQPSPSASPSLREIEGVVDANVVQQLMSQLQQMQGDVDWLKNHALLRSSMYAPDPMDGQTDASAPFMAYSNCQASDFFHPRFAALCKLMNARPHLHRKRWEWVYVLHKLIESGILREGSRGLGFGVGTEPLPAIFASFGVHVTATDAPDELDTTGGWHSTSQHSGSVEQLLNAAIAPDDLVRAKVEHRACDMNAIDSNLTGYDFNWSSCCFEHLGSIELGLQFVVNAVEKTLKPGGIAVHTTEYNASSDSDTVETGPTVIFRRRDMLELVQRLRQRGHHVEDFVIGPTAHALDFHVDAPPYSHDIHLKLLLAGYVSTSVGIVVRRGS